MNTGKVLGKTRTVEYHQERPKQPSGRREANATPVGDLIIIGRTTNNTRSGTREFFGDDVRCREARDTGLCLAVEQDRGECRIASTEGPWEFRGSPDKECGDHGICTRETVEAFRGRRGTVGELPWKTAE